MKRLFRVHMSTKHVTISCPLRMDMFIYEEQEAFETKSIDAFFIKTFPEYDLVYVHIASDAEAEAYSQGYDLGYNNAKEEQ